MLPLLLLGMPASAQDEAPPREGTTLILSESATREVEQDTILARLVARAEGEAPAAVQATVNRAMADALEQARAAAGVRVATGGYRVQQRYNREGQPVSWIAEQELRLAADEAASVLQLVGALQESGLVVEGLGFELSPAMRREVEDELTIEAIERLRARAEGIADALETDVARVMVLTVGGTVGIPPGPRFEARAMAADAAPPPSAVPDRETVSVDVNAEIALAPR